MIEYLPVIGKVKSLVYHWRTSPLRTTWDYIDRSTDHFFIFKGAT